MPVNEFNLLRSLQFARGRETTQDAIFSVVFLSDEIQMFKISRETGEITDFRPPITNFAAGMSQLSYMDNKPKTNIWFLSYHTDITGVVSNNGFFKVEITPESVNQIFFKILAELHAAVSFLDTPESDTFFTYEKEIGTEPEHYLRLYSTSSNTPTVLKSVNIGAYVTYRNAEFLTSISAVALNKPYFGEVDLYDESLTKKGQIKITSIPGKDNYVKSISEVTSAKRLITLGSQGTIDVWDLSNLSLINKIHSLNMASQSRKLYFKAIGLVEADTVLIREVQFGKNFQNKFMRVDYTKEAPGIVSKSSEFAYSDPTFVAPKNVAGVIDDLYSIDDS